ncbi:MAG TPA: ATP-binding cassette domain-containing protein [Stellaceae bacterium]|jgi:ABC-type multidrug transport system fused ATPase/permease subunit|nr:ATP-binding cassette domain-containing protein [Stellaceae bacterium]
MSTLAAALRDIATVLRAHPVARERPADDAREAALAAGLRLMPVGASRRRWWRQDQPPLLAHDDTTDDWIAITPTASGGLAEPLDAGRAARLGNELFVAYPRWPHGPATAAQWLAMAAPRHGSAPTDGLLLAGAALLPVLPGLTALLFASAAPASRPVLLTALACLAAGSVLAGWATALGRLRRGRDVGLRLHGLLWDRLLGVSTAALRRFPNAVLAMRLRDALAAAQREAEMFDRLRENSVTLAAAVTVLGIASPALAVLCVLEWLAGFAIVHRLWRAVGAAALTAGDYAPTLEKALAASGLVPTFRAMRAAAWLLGRSARTIATTLGGGGAVARASILARAGFRSLFLLQLVTLGVAIAAGLAGPLPPADLAAALLADCAAAYAMFQISAIAGTRQARQVRISAAMPALTSPPEEASDTSFAAPLGRFDSLALSGVQFGYSGAHPVLRGLDLTIGRGNIIALTGANGSGKTTLLRIIAGALQPDAGRLQVNGHDLTAARRSTFAACVGLVLQDTEMTAVTIRGAILGSRPLPLDLAEDAARLVGLDSIIAGLPMGMQTLVVPGVFPDGLVQRLMLARALAGRPELLLIDEVLSALDAGQRDRLLREFRQRGTTVVFTAFDPSVLAAADRELCLEAGRITG